MFATAPRPHKPSGLPSLDSTSTLSAENATNAIAPNQTCKEHLQGKRCPRYGAAYVRVEPRYFHGDVSIKLAIEEDNGEIDDASK